MTDKRYLFGIWVTVLYVVALAIYAYVQSAAMLAMEPNEFGDALAGAASPLAFLWLVLGYLQQGDELRQNTEALRLQAQELRDSVEQQARLAETSQLQLDAYKDQLKRSEEAQIPRFVLLPRKADLHGVNKQFTIAVRNVGAKCSGLTVVLDWGGGFNQSQEIGDVDSFGKFDFNFSWPNFPIEPRTFTFLLQYYVLQGGIRSTVVPMRFFWVVEGLLFFEQVDPAHVLGPSP
jgi:hypothetical protein